MPKKLEGYDDTCSICCMLCIKNSHCTLNMKKSVFSTTTSSLKETALSNTTQPRQLEPATTTTTVTVMASITSWHTRPTNERGPTTDKV